VDYRAATGEAGRRGIWLAELLRHPSSRLSPTETSKPSMRVRRPLESADPRSSRRMDAIVCSLKDEAYDGSAPIASADRSETHNPLFAGCSPTHHRS